MKKCAAILLSLAMITGMVFAVGGCDRFKKLDKDRSSKNEDDEQTEETIEVTDEALEGIWYDSHGPFLVIDPKGNTLEFVRENRNSYPITSEYELRSISEDGFCLVDHSDNSSLNYMSYFTAGQYSPILYDCEFLVPFTLTSEGHMDLMGYDLFREDTKEAKEILSKIEEHLFNDTFKAFEASCTLTEDTLTFEKNDQIFDIDYESGMFTASQDSYDIAGGWAYLSDKDSDDVVICFSNFYLGNSDSRSPSEVMFEDKPFSIDPVTFEKTLYFIEDDHLILTDKDGNIKESLEITDNSETGISTDDSRTLFLFGSGCVFGRYDLYLVGDVQVDGIYYPWTLRGIAYDYRQDVLDGKIKNEVYTENVLNIKLSGGTKITAKIDTAGEDIKDIWLPDYANISIFSQDETVMTGYPSDGNVLTDTIKISSMKSEKVEFSLDIKTDCPEEYISVVEQDKGIIDIDLDLTPATEGYTARFTVTEPGSYSIYDTRKIIAESTEVTPETLFEMDPNMSYWAVNENTGDIPDLVDLDYIKSSVFDLKTGSADFWVSTPEELASVVYYVNSLPVADGTETQVMYYVHLLNDIDLEGYEWASLGYTYWGRSGDLDCEYAFRGVIFGNGYSIKNMTLGDGNESFIKCCHLATVIGLTLDHPTLNYTDYGTRDCFIGDGQCITELFDCHVILDGGEDYEFSAGDNDSINYFNCSMIIDGKEEELDKELYKPFYYNGVDNWIRAFYQSDGGSYNYDAEAEYEAYMEDTLAFDKMYYYYGMDEEAESHIGYLDFRGWMVGEEFYLNFGYVYQE